MPGTQPSRRLSILLGAVSQSIPYPLMEEKNDTLEDRNVWGKCFVVLLTDLCPVNYKLRSLRSVTSYSMDIIPPSTDVPSSSNME